jgi:hypothetical protein
MTNDEFQMKAKIRNPICSRFSNDSPKTALNAPHSKCFAQSGVAGQSRSVWSAVASAPLFGCGATSQDSHGRSLRFWPSGFGLISDFRLHLL